MDTKDRLKFTTNMYIDQNLIIIVFVLIFKKATVDGDGVDISLLETTYIHEMNKRYQSSCWH